ncbi:MAG: hypothetical protein AAF437_07235 [Pseudomonadota bacterium]
MSSKTNQQAASLRSISPNQIANIVAGVIILIQGLYTYFLLNPVIGIDDANITQTYAAAFAQRFEFNYYPGGELVEGSTSLLWTLANSVLFLIPGPAETYVTIACFGLTFLTLRNCWQIGWLTFLSEKGVSLWLYSALFMTVALSVPTLFAWSLWTLMDITLWLTLLSGILFFATRQLVEPDRALEPRQQVWLTICIALLPICRPEGIAIALGMSLYLIAFAVVNQKKAMRNQFLLAMAAALLVFAFATVWRLTYFGVPFPNTYYAKVSSDLIDQAMFGLHYLRWYLTTDSGLILILLAFGTGLASLTSAWRPVKAIFEARGFQVLFVLGVFGLYTMLGGDHFDSYRFYQPAHLILIPWIAGRLCFLLHKYGFISRPPVVLGVTAMMSMLALTSLNAFAIDGGGLGKEFRIAEDGRAIGQKLNRLAPQTSLGIVPAGGISRTYTQGPIYDLMGLNWSEMAHATEDLSGTFRNHGAFSDDVFWRVEPDVMLPALHDCAALETYPDPFWNHVLKGLLESERFTANYELLCLDSVAMYVRRETSATIRASLNAPS